MQLQNPISRGRVRRRGARQLRKRCRNERRHAEAMPRLRRFAREQQARKSAKNMRREAEGTARYFSCG